MVAKIRGMEIGNIEEDLLNACIRKHGFRSTEEALVYYLRKGWDLGEDKDINECLKEASSKVKIYDFDDIASLMVGAMQKDLRPANEICKNCNMYKNQFCCYRQCQTSPFNKGCEGWESAGEESNISHIYSSESPIHVHIDKPESEDIGNITRIGDHCKEITEIDKVKRMAEDILNGGN